MQTLKIVVINASVERYILAATTYAKLMHFELRCTH